MNRTGMDSVNTAQGYPQVAETEVKAKTGQSRNGYEVTETAPTPVLTSPELQVPSFNPAPIKKVTIGQRLACPFTTAGNLFTRTLFNTVHRAVELASIPGLLVGGIAGAAVSIPVAGVVKLVEMLARTNTNYGPKVILGGAVMGAVLGASTTGRIGAFAGALAGAGLGIVGGLIGFGKGVRDAVTGDVQRLKREKLTLNDFFEQLRENEKKTDKEFEAHLNRFFASGHDDMANQSGSPAVALESPSRVLTNGQDQFDFSTANLGLLQENEANSAV
ncbi:hypothetical protein [Endozoicomonas lisbonensis]|uniref:Glycine zipper domain-containing protein n=1 Tax=Endozoicomonas lisbonensis TaxID=3120522 RepID=A0ABV2SI94_9GAMM